MADEFRPKYWEDFIGQEKLKDRLDIHIRAANERKEPLDHVLLIGTPGCGKTTLASLIAAKHYANMESLVMPVEPTLLISMASEHEGILFLDELHRLSPKQQESLLTLIEDRYVQWPNGYSIECPLVTIVGATTEPQKIIEPLYDRFQIKPPYDDYTDSEMGQIVTNMAERVGIAIKRRRAKALGRATGGVPRNAKMFVKMARDLDTTNVRTILDKCRVTKDGLTEYHLRYLKALQNCGGKAGLSLLAAHVKLPDSEVINLEQLLVKRNMVSYTSGGRSMMPKGFKVVKDLD